MSILFDDNENSKDTRLKYGRTDPNSQATSRKYDELLVFGYHCKLFRDEENAKSVNEGKTLIPWMGDKDLMIDRYDCRGHLYKLEEFDSDGKSQEKDLTPEERDVENICDEERYKDLTNNTLEEDILKEEEEKRSKALYDPYTAYQSYKYTYNQKDSKDGGKSLSEYMFDEETFKKYCQYYGLDHTDENVKAYYKGQSYQYDYERPPPPPEPPSTQTTKTAAKQNSTHNPPPAPPVVVVQKPPEKFLPPEGLEIPKGVIVPETRKMQSIIEKTAMFISKQTGQMEIVLKTKQSGNPQFNFLNFDDYMNPYYKFVLGKIKEGVFTPKDEEKIVEEKKEEIETKKDENDSNEDDDSSDNDADGGELHPLLQAHRRPIAKKVTPLPPKPILKTTPKKKHLVR